jgi:hypothetical protein
LDLALLIDAQHHRLLRRVEVEPDDVGDLGFELGSVLNLKPRVRWGWRSWSRQTRRTVDLPTPTRSATARLDQWVWPLGGRPRVTLMILATTRSSWVRGRPRPGASCSKPVTPASSKRRRQSSTVGMEQWSSSAIAALAIPWAARRTIRARRT